MLAREAVLLCPAILGLVLSTITSPSPRSPEYLRNLVLGWAWSMGDATFLALCLQSIRNNGHDAPPPATVGVVDLGVPPGRFIGLLDRPRACARACTTARRSCNDQFLSR